MTARFVTEAFQYHLCSTYRRMLGLVLSGRALTAQVRCLWFDLWRLLTFSLSSILPQNIYIGVCHIPSLYHVYMVLLHGYMAMWNSCFYDDKREQNSLASLVAAVESDPAVARLESVIPSNQAAYLCRQVNVTSNWGKLQWCIYSVKTNTGREN